MLGVKCRVCTRLFCVLRVRKAQNVCDVPKMRFLDCFPATFSGYVALEKEDLYPGPKFGILYLF